MGCGVLAPGVGLGLLWGNPEPAPGAAACNGGSLGGSLGAAGQREQQRKGKAGYYFWLEPFTRSCLFFREREKKK